MASTISPISGPLDPGDPTPLHEQVAAELRRAIAEGQAGPGERLPPAADLAAVLRKRSPAYSAEDMTDDAVAVLDALGRNSAHPPQAS